MGEICFPVLCWFLPYNNADQPKSNIYPLPSEPALPPPAPPSRASQSSSLGSLSYRATSLQLCFTHGEIHMSMLLSPSVLLSQINSMSMMSNWISSLICHSVAKLGPILCNHRDCSPPGSSAPHVLPESAQVHIHWVGESAMPSNRLILCYPLLLPPSIFPSIRVFSNKSALHIRWPKDCFFSFSNSPSDEYSGLIPFRMDWFELLAVDSSSSWEEIKGFTVPLKLWPSLSSWLHGNFSLSVVCSLPRFLEYQLTCVPLSIHQMLRTPGQI